jgi:NAD+ synthase
MILKIEECIEDIKKQIKDFTDIAIIGLSGGADSTLVATLCTLALGKKEVCGIQMPCEDIDLETFNTRSQLIANTLGIYNDTYNIKKAASNLPNFVVENFNQASILTGNIKARLRMICLYAYCEAANYTNQGKRARVIGTDNLSENFLGYFTKFGDGGVDINPIEELYKSEVYQLLDYFRDKGIITEECIDRVPSAGLWEGQTDEGELGMTYDEIEKSIRKVNNYVIKDIKSIDEKVMKMHQQTQHKREIPGKFELRKYCD